MRLLLVILGGIFTLITTTKVRADCWMQGVDRNKPVDIALFVAGLNHLYWPDGTEAAPAIAVDAPIGFLADEIKQRYPLDSKLIVAITGNKHTTNFPDNTNHPADRLQNLLRERGVQVGGSVGEDQFRVIHGPGWIVQSQQFVSYPPAFQGAPFNGFFVVKLRAMNGDQWDWRTPDLHLVVFRPHVDKQDVRTKQLEFLASYVRAIPTNFRTARPILVGDTNSRYPTQPETILLRDSGYDWITFQLPCGPQGPSIFGGGESDLMNVLIGRNPAKPLGFNPAFIGFQVGANGAPARPFEGIHVPQLAHNVVSIFLQRTSDALYCAPGQRVCEDGSCRASCPSVGNGECSAGLIVCPCSDSGCATNHAQCTALCSHHH